VPLLDVSRQYAPLQAELEAAAIAVLRSGQYVLGPVVADLERGIADYCGTRHAVGCASGSDALLLALMAAGVGPGDEVIVPSFTFFATASAPWRLGAKVVLADIDPVTFNIDPAEVAAKITPATRAIIPVHLFGQCADIDAIRAACKKSASATGKIWLIEDACQAIGAEWRRARAGSLADIGCLSFYPTKNLGGMGDGGMLTTNDNALAERLRLLRGHGMQPRYYHHVVGINSRLDSLQAALLSVKLPHLQDWSLARASNAQRYTQLFVKARLDKQIVLPQPSTDGWHVWNQYVIRVPGGQRDALRAHLADRKIGTEIYYPLCLHQQTCFASLGYTPGSLSHSEQAAAEVLALPIYPELTGEEQQTVVAAVSNFYQQAPSTTPPILRAPKFLSETGVRSEGLGVRG
jgi:dTDP-4-amino-4,6-dideoxygalactose transaminase